MGLVASEMADQRPICARVFLLPCPDTTAKTVLMALAAFADPNTLTCWPAVSTLAKGLMLDRRTIQRALRRLEDCGLLKGLGRVGGRSEKYQIVIDAQAAPAPHAAPTPQAAPGSHRGGTSAAPHAAPAPPKESGKSQEEDLSQMGGGGGSGGTRANPPPPYKWTGF